MRHQKKKRHLNVDDSHRKAIARTLVTSLVIHGRIKTTKAKAKLAQPLAENMITVGKTKDTMNAIRKLNSVFYEEKASKKLLEELVPKYKDRQGGYTRIVKLGFRAGDNAEMVMLELV